ncbi:MAG: MarR family transcriptional regulator [Rubellimicrobium sp.]|nr:MarR family transcriptional regulator [Rubellimicrobium sp.]
MSGTRGKPEQFPDSPEATPVSRDEMQVMFARSGYALETHPAHLVRRVHQRATQHFQQVMEGDNLSPTQFAALATILKHGAVSQNHLGRLTSMDPSTISVVVRKLIKDGLVRRRRSTMDQRLTILTLTERGQDFTLARLEQSNEVGRRLLAPLDPRERAVFLSLLARLCADEADDGMESGTGDDATDLPAGAALSAQAGGG